MVGNNINIVGDGIYQITARASTNSITVDRNTGTATGQTMNVGGALLTLGKLAGVMVAGNKAYVTGAFTTTAAISFTQSIGGTTNTRIIGYGATRGDALHATVTLTANTGITVISAGSAVGFSIEQVDVDCGSFGTSIGMNFGQIALVQRCKVANFTSKGINLTNIESYVADCELTGGGAAASAALFYAGSAGAGCAAVRCFVHDNACVGIFATRGPAIRNCLIANNSGATSDGVQIGTDSVLVTGNTIHNNGRHGINLTSANQTVMEWRNNILSNNGGFGIADTGGTLAAAAEYDGNAYFSNTSGARSNIDSTTGIFGVAPYTNVRDVTLSVSPYVGGTTGTTANFALNNTAGGGAACRKAGSPGTWPGNTGTTGFLDMGAVQSQGTSNPPQVITAP
jgi:hypothetical protein